MHKDFSLRARDIIAYVIFGIGIIFFIKVSLHNIDSPGVYYDEAIFAPVTLKLIENCNIQAAVSYSIGCFPLLQSPPYVGALKAYLYAPIFWLFGVSPESIRLPMIFISGLIIVLVFFFIRKRFGPLYAAVAFILMATDPVYIFHSRIDWGPFVLANFFKLLSIGFCLKWLEKAQARYLALMIATLLLGSYDKLNFLWMIIALGTAIILIYPVLVCQWLEKNRRLAITLLIPFILVVAVMVIRANMLKSLNIGGGGPFDFAAQLTKIRELYELTFSGEAQYTWMFNRSPKVTTSWTSYLIIPQLIFGTLLSLALIFRPTSPFSPNRILAFFNILLLVLIAQMIATKEVGGSHHLVMVWPLHYLHLVLCGRVILTWMEAEFKAIWIKKTSLTIAMLGIILIGVQHVKVTSAYTAALDPNGRFSSRFDPVIYKLVEALKDSHVDHIISVDWGIHQTALSLAPSWQRTIYLDWWPIFMQPPGVDSKRDMWLRDTYLANKTVIFVTHFPSKATFSDAVINFEKYLSYWCLGPVMPTTIANHDGEPFYQILKFNLRGNNGVNG
jgi:4-amino-4-deoxy-L-arabinose transferase-like glycosyltransferase